MSSLLVREGMLDRLAIGLSGICLVHCIATSLILALAASAGGLLFDPLVHEIGLGIAILLGALALGRGAMMHGQMLPVAIGSLGLGVMMGAMSLPHDGSESLFTIIGVALLAYGHHLNSRAAALA
ncbi:CHASE2 domain-containing sensor protein [Sphingomonas zeicaulis]